MLDNETKRRIDTARDILVGKVPDPKSQVEQITIALIYKFMDDMDKEAVEFGGQATFFTGEYEKYSWTKIFDVRLGGHEMLDLYGEAIIKLNHNPNIPQLFRDIFKNAFLPYRDPETLKLFLKTINEFQYDHSERLGDAFEYLLSVLGSQGDAGQFRTPRHIIDFIVQVLQPKKNETVCDPACGTSGFLISSYKYIQEQNTKKTKGDALTPDDRKKLMQNFTGYDISPDMVRLSLVNMYLHGFTAPRIYEYDTLTSEDRWGDYFDIIMANPPFMTPKGGIKPHKKFTMQANRSEVLFVDYIAEHINPTTGRAGVIVPEGIIFQSATAYKSLRKLLVDKHYLYAVVSLPAGIFQPYSGVKTSILLMDKTIAKKNKDILFVKVEADGFDLGAQRRPIDKNDLPETLNTLVRYKEAVLNDETFVTDGKNVLLVAKEKIKANADYNLSIDRYRAGERKLSKWDFIRLGDICQTTSGGTPLKSKTEYYENGIIPWLKSGEVAQGYVYKSEEFITEEGLKNSSAKILPVNTVLVAMYGATAGQVGLLKFQASTNQAVCGILPNEKIIPEYLYLCLKSKRDYLIQLSNGGAQPNISQTIIKDLEIPLPPLSIQQEIVNKIEGYQLIKNGAKQVVENYKPQIDIDPEWEMVELGSLCEKILSGGTPSTENSSFWNGTIPWISSADIIDLKTAKPRRFINETAIQNSATNLIPKGNIVVVTRVGLGKLFLNDFDVCISQDSQGLILKEALVKAKYLLYILFEKVQGFKNTSQGTTIQGVTKYQLSSLQIPLPALYVQQQIVQQIEKEQQLVNANKELIKIYEQKIKDEINKLWQAEEKTNTVPHEPLTVSETA